MRIGAAPEVGAARSAVRFPPHRVGGPFTATGWACEESSMASKTKAAQKEKEKEEAPEKEATEAPDTPLPLLDLSDAAVKKLIRTAKKRGYVTHDQINSVLPSEEVNSEQIEDVLAMFSEMGVNVVETEEAETEEEHKEEAEEEPEAEGELVEVTRAVP